jgi:hypothetical protein
MLLPSALAATLAAVVASLAAAPLSAHAAKPVPLQPRAPQPTTRPLPLAHLQPVPEVGIGVRTDSATGATQVRAWNTKHDCNGLSDWLADGSASPCGKSFAVPADLHDGKSGEIQYVKGPWYLGGCGSDRLFLTSAGFNMHGNYSGPCQRIEKPREGKGCEKWQLSFKCWPQTSEH